MAGQPLTTQEAEEMTQIVIGASVRVPPSGWVVSNSTDWDAVDARARGVLTPEQFALFKIIEPHAALDGMGSRFSARLHRLSDQAREADRRGEGGMEIEMRAARTTPTRLNPLSIQFTSSLGG